MWQSAHATPERAHREVLFFYLGGFVEFVGGGSQVGIDGFGIAEDELAQETEDRIIDFAVFGDAAGAAVRGGGDLPNPFTGIGEIFVGDFDVEESRRIGGDFFEGDGAAMDLLGPFARAAVGRQGLPVRNFGDGSEDGFRRLLESRHSGDAVGLGEHHADQGHDEDEGEEGEGDPKEYFHWELPFL
jgi:hypothetical protein